MKHLRWVVLGLAALVLCACADGYLGGPSLGANSPYQSTKDGAQCDNGG
jgi:hypothetical protein